MRTGSYLYLLFIILLTCMIPSCSDDVRDSRFKDIESRIEADPEAAVRYVDSLNADKVWKESMNAAERARFDLLRIKSADKAYVRHTSDSLIRSVLAYYEKHTGSEQYPEALYYGGRVYSDLGDSPTSLRYFQQALDADTDTPSTPRFRTNILFQLSYLLNRLRLYDEAIPYLEEDISIIRELKDSVLLAEDLQMLGNIYMYKKDFDKAYKLFQESKFVAQGHSKYLYTYADMYLAAIHYHKKDWSRALSLIRGVPERLNGKGHSEALAYGANIYLGNSIIDTAYLYANELIRYSDSYNRHLGYKILLNNSVRKLVHADSLDKYYKNYAELVEERIDNNSGELVLMQRSYYNYDLQERKRKEAELINNRIGTGLILTVIITLLCLVIILYQKNINKRKSLDLIISNQIIDNLRQELKRTEILRNNQIDTKDKDDIKQSLKAKISDPDTDPNTAQDISQQSDSYSDLRTEFVTKLLSLLNDKSEIEALPDVLINSDVYKTLQHHVENRIAIKDNSKIWEDLEEIINISFPSFNSNLELLTRGKFIKSERRMAMLVKCGISPRSLQYLLCITKGGVSSRRIRFGLKLFDKKLSTGDIDWLIRYL